MKTFTIAALIFLFAVSINLSGCATMFHGKPELDVVGPPGMQAQSPSGGAMMSYYDGSELILHPDPAHADSLRLTYEGHSTSVALAKNPSALEILNLFSYGIGFPVDDLSHSWFNYAPVYVTIDSSATGLNGISASSLNWLGEQAGSRSLHALIMLGMGGAFQLSPRDGIPLPFGVNRISYPVFTFQTGLGVDYAHAVELFFLFRDDPSYAISSDNNYTSDVSAGDLCFRYFLKNGWFAQGSFGKAYATNNYSVSFDPLTGMYASSNSSPSFTEIGAALGWAGDISYISLQYFEGLSSFNTNEFSNIRYHTVFLNFGLNFRL